MTTSVTAPGDDACASPHGNNRSSIPPRPVNPELLRLHTELFSKISTEMSTLFRILLLDSESIHAERKDLLYGQAAVHDETSRLETVLSIFRYVIGRMKETTRSISAAESGLQNSVCLEADELICAATIVHYQYSAFMLFEMGNS